jgi:hypothetical protein
MFIDLGQIIEVRKAWEAAGEVNDSFLSRYSDVFGSVEIGCTFIPENLGYDGLNHGEVLAVLSCLVEVFGVRKIRLGIRLNQVDLAKGELGIYDKILEYCFKNNVELTLNLGPIKSCGWPEYHLSETIKQAHLPSIKSVVSCDHDVSIVSMQELKKLLMLITQKYTKHQLKNITTLQPENECFNPFGEYKWTFDGGHLSEVIRLLDAYLPNRQILMNSAGLFDMDKIIQYLSHRDDANRFVVGLDYYYVMDGWEKNPLIRWLDLYVLSWKWGNMGLGKLRRLQKKYRFTTQVTEAQVEPWGSAVEPGNSVKSLKYVLLRSSQFLRQNTGLISMYGLDRLAKKYLTGDINGEHTEMIDLIQKVQEVKSLGNKR